MLREELEEALRGHNADFVEIRVEETESTQLSYRDRELDEVGRNVNLGVRARRLQEAAGASSPSTPSPA